MIKDGVENKCFKYVNGYAALNGKDLSKSFAICLLSVIKICCRLIVRNFFFISDVFLTIKNFLKKFLVLHP